MKKKRKKNHREIAEVVNPTKCKTCEEIFHLIVVHHIDGNHDNNNKKNLVKVCSKCHSLIHRGCKSKRMLYEQRGRLSKIGKLRIKWIKGKRFKIPSINDDCSILATKPLIFPK